LGNNDGVMTRSREPVSVPERRGTGDEDRGLHVVMATARFPPLIGGTEAHVQELSSRLAARGHHVRVITTVLDRRCVGEDVVDGVSVVRLRAFPRRNDLYFAPSLRRAILESPADIVHVQGYHTSVAPLAMAAARHAGRPYVVTFHSGGHSSRLRRAIRPLHWRAIRRQLLGAARLVGVSEHETEFFRSRLDLPSGLLVTIPNGVSEEFQGVDSVPRQPHLVTTIGRLEAYKGHQKVIAALPAVRREVPDVRLRVIGSGPHRLELQRLAARLDLADRVEFVAVDYGDRARMAALLREAAVIALMSSYESQGIVAYEAVAAGARVVVADGSALTEIARYPGVEVVTVHGGHHLEAALVRQLSEPPVRERREVPTWNDTTDRVESVYREVLSSA
jgi:glycosyltransferase involved in cell wall biosynthesis